MPIPRLIKKYQPSPKPVWRQTEKLRRDYRPTSDWQKKPKVDGGLKNLLFGRRAFKLYFYGLLGLLFAGVVAFFVLGSNLPDPNKLMERQIAQSTKIYDRTGKIVLYEVHGDEKRTLVPLSEIPMNVRNATLAIEDKDFYKHGAFSLWAIFRTAITNILYHRSAGGSTLTQQFIKNSVLTNEKTITRKIKELILSYRLEQKFSKDEILQLYLNEIPYGSTAYGVEAAAQKYFGKNIKDVNLAEATILAALPQAPSRYSPYGPNKDLLIGRQQYILDQMVVQGYISQDEAEAAKKTELAFKKPTEQMLAPHFVMYVKELASEKYGDALVESGGLKIITTLDYDKQKIAEEVITEKTPKNEEKYQATNAALVSIDPKTGQILAMVGSKDYWSDKIDGQYNVVTGSRQPGSSFKPIVYTAAFIKGYTPNTVLYDVVTNFSTDPAKPYEPHNYDLGERGPVTIKKALAGSLNIPAVKAIYLTGMNNVLDLADKLGYTTLKERDRFGLSLVLGGGEVRLLEHANAFSAFATDGKLHPSAAILKIEDKDGKLLEEYQDQEETVLDPQIARLTTSILSDNSARAYIFGEKNYLTLPNRPVAAKTGTTNDYKDAWTIGFTPSLVTGVWVGNNDFTSMKKGADGSVVAAPIWHDYMARALASSSVEAFTTPEPIVTGKPVLDGDTSGGQLIKIDRASGLLATDLTPPSFIEEKLFSAPHDILYYISKDDPRGPAPTNPAADPQFSLWENAVAGWLKKHSSSTSATGTPPTGYDNVHKTENQPLFTIEEPLPNQTVNQNLIVRINGSAPRGLGRVEYYLDGNYFYVNSSYPFGMEKNLSFLTGGYHDLTVRVCDDIDNCSEQKISFNLQNSSIGRTDESISFNLTQPGNGLAVNKIDFPLELKFEIYSQPRLSKIVVYYRSGTSTDSVVAATIAPIEGSAVSGYWKKAPPKGSITFWAEAFDWYGHTAQTGEKTLTVQ
jgi:1A family penicillin-binding protein